MNYYVKGAIDAKSTNGKKYIRLTLVEESTDTVFDAFCWEPSIEAAECMSKVINSQVNPLDKFPKVYPVELESGVELGLIPEIPDNFIKFLKKVPSKEEFISKFKEAVEFDSIESGILKGKLEYEVERLHDLYLVGFGGAIMHHAYSGGLLQHTYEILNSFVALRPSLPFKVDSVVCGLGILYHDYGKLYEYDSCGAVTEAMSLTPHSYLGAVEVLSVYSSILEYRVVQMIQHVILSHHGKKEYGACVEPQTLEALVVNLLDELSGKGDHMNRCSNMEKSYWTGGRVIR